MKRTTISLPDDLARALELESRRQRTSVSEVARRMLATGLGFDGGERREVGFASLGDSGDHDVAERIEELLAREWGRDRDR